MRLTCGGALLALLCAMPMGVSAQEEGPSGSESVAEPTTEELEARALFDRGRELAQARRFSEAADAFQRSRALVDRASTSFNLAVCLFTLGLHIEALEVLEAYRAQADPVADASGIEDAERMLEHARASVAHLELELLPVEARMTVDGVLVEGGGTRELAVNAGTHVIRVEAVGHAPALIEVSVASAETARRAISLTSTRIPAQLRVDAPRGADSSLEIDGRPVALGAALELPAGAHTVRLSAREGEASVERELELEWNEHRELWLELAPEPPPQADLVEDPGLWVGVAGGAVAVALGVALGVLLAPPPSAHGGSSGVVLEPGGNAAPTLVFP